MFDGLLNISTLLAQASGQEQEGSFFMVYVMPMLIILFIFWIFLWRPQAKKQREQSEMLNALKSGDEVVTRGGIIGTVKSIDDQIATLELSKNTKIKILRSQIQGLEEQFVGDESDEEDED